VLLVEDDVRFGRALAAALVRHGYDVEHGPARRRRDGRVSGLRSGADDYVVKPFGFAELEARMEAVLRRTRPWVAGTFTVGRLRVDLDCHQVYVDSDPIAMTRKEFELLSVLAAQPETAIRREHLLEKVWQTTCGARRARSMCTSPASARRSGRWPRSRRSGAWAT
jgi:DNA-binding response OmpR family regulator